MYQLQKENDEILSFVLWHHQIKNIFKNHIQIIFILLKFQLAMYTIYLFRNLFYNTVIILLELLMDTIEEPIVRFSANVLPGTSSSFIVGMHLVVVVNK